MPAHRNQPPRAGACVLSRSADVLSRRGAFGVVVLGGRAVRPVTLEGSGACLWDLLDCPRTDSELVDEMVQRFHADPVVVARDLGPVLDQLIELGILEASDGEAGAPP